MNGAPAKPISGTRSPSAARARRTVSKTKGTVSAGSRSTSRSTSAAERTGRRMTGPSPRENSRPTPSGSTRSRMSAKRMAASTPSFSTGSSVTSAATSGVRQSSRNPIRSRIARYSGRKRPAWRMSHTGVNAVGRRLAGGEERVHGWDWPPPGRPGGVPTRERGGHRAASP